jgi:hypothetical protein
VGSALLLAGIAFVLYRMYGRKNHDKINQDDEDFYAGSSDSVAGAKIGRSNTTATGDGWGTSSLTNQNSEPLDRYKNPTSPASQGYMSPPSFNKASNF